MTYDGSAPLCRRIVVIIDVVVVLPCVPVTAIPCRSSIRLASAADRCSTRSPRCRAATSSGFSGRIALEIDDRVGGTDVRGVVSDVHRGTGRGQFGQQRRIGRVAARDRHAARQHDPGDARHAGPADGDEVHSPEVSHGHRVDRGDKSHLSSSRCGADRPT